jgi:hypothetical protein
MELNGSLRDYKASLSQRSLLTRNLIGELQSCPVHTGKRPQPKMDRVHTAAAALALFQHCVNHAHGD